MSPSFEEIDPFLRSQIHSHVFTALKFYVNEGDYGPIPLRDIFFTTAHSLIKANVIQRPTHLGGTGAGGLKITTYVDRLNEFQDLFPDYGIDKKIAGFIRYKLWELFGQNILVPSTQEHNKGLATPSFFNWISFDMVILTPYGVKVIIEAEDRIQVHDPDGYFEIFLNASPPPDNEMMIYLKESMNVFRGGYLMACIILLGVASERLIDVLAENLRDAVEDGDKWFNEKYKKKNMSERFKAVEGKLNGEFGAELKKEDLKDAFDEVVKPTFHNIRIARNDIAHPNDNDFSWNETSGFLHNFVQYFKHINRIIAFLNE
jgi:hypothetical protein